MKRPNDAVKKWGSCPDHPVNDSGYQGSKIESGMRCRHGAPQWHRHQPALSRGRPSQATAAGLVGASAYRPGRLLKVILRVYTDGVVKAAADLWACLQSPFQEPGPPASAASLFIILVAEFSRLKEPIACLFQVEKRILFPEIGEIGVEIFSRFGPDAP